ncbi:MAG TPA: magnesium transporter CorA family protein [Acidimicrobiales bacterium]|nr:magnesium transporter CorA family protein [Acidimicrobiales bacterium]
MLIRTLSAGDDGCPVVTDSWPSSDDPRLWIDVIAGPDDVPDLLMLTDRAGLDRLAVRDTILDVDLPKVDDFGDHLLAVFHGLRDDQVGTYEVHCFLTPRGLVTIHDRLSPAVDAVWSQLNHRSDVGAIGPDFLLGLIADALTRRLMGVLEAFDDRVEGLIARALAADGDVLEDLSAVRADIAGIRRTVHPQREALDVLRHSTSPLVGDLGRRKFSDVFDVANRAASGLDEARSALAEILDAYRGAEARVTSEVSKVLTVYAAIMLPLSLIAGFFGMNFADLPWTGSRWGWLAATGIMLAVATISLGMFISLGWVRRPSGRRATRAIGRGLLEATRAPVQVVGAVLEVTTFPIRATGGLIARQTATSETDDDPQQGSE